MKRFFIILFSFSLVFSMCGCSEKTSKSILSIFRSPDFSIDDIDWMVETGISGGNRYVFLHYMNNTEYPILYFDLTFTEKDIVSEEEKNNLYAHLQQQWRYTDEQMEELKRKTIKMHTYARDSFIAPGSSSKNIRLCYYEGSAYVSDIAHYNLLKPDIATIKYVKNNLIYTAYYDFLNKKFSYEDETEIANYWTDSPLGDMISKPVSPVIIKDFEYRPDGFYFEAYDITTEEFENYVEDCKKNGFTIDIKKYGDSFAAYNGDGYELDIDYWSSSKSISIKLTPP